MLNKPDIEVKIGFNGLNTVIRNSENVVVFTSGFMASGFRNVRMRAIHHSPMA